MVDRSVPRWLRSLGAVLLPLAMGAHGCACRAPQPEPPPVAPPLPSGSAALAVPPAPSGPQFLDLESVQPVLADPRLDTVARMEALRDYAGAARALESALATLPPTGDERVRWTYQVGRLASQGRMPELAQRSFLAVARETHPLATYAAVAAAQESIRAGRHDEGLKLLATVPDDVPVAATARLLAGEAHERKGTLAAAVPLWRAHLASGNHPVRWADVSLRAARALLGFAESGTVPPTIADSRTTAVEEALRLARRVALEAPTSASAEAAVELEKRAIAALPPDRQAALAARTHEDELTRVTALDAAQKTTDADKALAALWTALTPDEKAGSLGCKTSLLVAQVKGKRKQKAAAAEAFDEPIARCSGDLLVTALYQGGKASAVIGRQPEAMARFERVEKEAPTSKLADDARVRGADAALRLGDEARFSSMLERIADAYPEGDMVTEGLFKLALHRIDKGDWNGAVAPLEQAKKARPRERAYWAAGRAHYFHARALFLTGDKKRGIDELAEVITTHPLSYYMLLAHARLAAVDGERAKKTLEEALAREEKGPFTIPDRPAFHTAGFQRALELLRQGENDFARAEIGALGLSGTDAEAEVLWAVALLYSRAGAHHLSHALARGRLTDWLDHYPAGRWKSAWEVAYPRPHREVVERETRQSGIPTSLAYAIMREESAFDAGAVSPSRAFGLMQLILPTARHMAKKVGIAVDEEGLKTPATNIALGCRYLSILRNQFPDCPALAVPSYNAGPGAPKKWLAERPGDELDLFVERIPYEETRNYTKRVLTSYAAYLALYEQDRLGEALRMPMHPHAPPATAPLPDAAALEPTASAEGSE